MYLNKDGKDESDMAHAMFRMLECTYGMTGIRIVKLYTL